MGPETEDMNVFTAEVYTEIRAGTSATRKSIRVCRATCSCAFVLAFFCPRRVLMTANLLVMS